MTKSDASSLAGAFQRQRELEQEVGVGAPAPKPGKSTLKRVDLQPLEGKVYLDMIQRYKETLRPLSPLDAKKIVQQHSRTKNPSATLNRMAKAGAITQDGTRKNHVSRIPIQDIAAFVEGRQIWPEPSFARVNKKAPAEAPAAIPPVRRVASDVAARRDLEFAVLDALRTQIVEQGPKVHALYRRFRDAGMEDNQASGLYSSLREAETFAQVTRGVVRFDLRAFEQFVTARRKRQGLPAPTWGTPVVQPSMPVEPAAVAEPLPAEAPQETGEMPRYTPTEHERAVLVPPEPSGSMEERINARMAQLNEHDREIDAQVASLTDQRNRNAAMREELERLLQAERDLKERASALGVV